MPAAKAAEFDSLESLDAQPPEKIFEFMAPEGAIQIDLRKRIAEEADKEIAEDEDEK